MSYVEEVSFALIRALDQPSFHKGVRLAGFEANLDFWIEEIRHCLECIAGYEARFGRLKAARTNYAKERREELDPILVTSTITSAELVKLDKRVREASTRFLRLCNIPFPRQREIEDILGIRVREDQQYD